MDGFELVQAIESQLKRRGISKAKFYEDTGISSATFSQWRNKIYAPSSAALAKIEEYLGITFTIEQKEKPTLQTESELDSETIELRGIWDSADGDERRALLEMARLIKSRRNK